MKFLVNAAMEAPVAFTTAALLTVTVLPLMAMIFVPGRKIVSPDGNGRTPDTVRPTARFSRPLVTVMSLLSGLTSPVKFTVSGTE